MTLPTPASPLPRHLHHSFAAERTVWLWEGRTPVLPRPDIPTLTQCFDTETGSWLAPTAKEDGLPGLCEACVQVGTVVYCLVRIFRSACLTLFSSGLNATSTQFPRWEQVTQADYPLPWYEQIYLVSKGGQELLVLFAAKETAQLHVFDLSNKYWSVPEVSGMPPGLTGSTLTSVDELHAVLFGGGLPETNRAYLLDMGGWSWSEIASSSPLKPPPRSHHSACLITPTSSHPLLLVVGGLAPPSDPRCDLTHCDAWLLDFHAELWRRVDLPDAVQTSRCIGSRGKILAKPVLLEITNGVSSLIELCRQYLVRHYSEYSSAALDLLPVGVARAIAAEHMRRANFQQLGIAVAPLRL